MKSNCSLHTTVDLKSPTEQPISDEGRVHLERFDSVESFQTRTSIESSESMASTESYETVRLDFFLFEITCRSLKLACI